MAVRGPAAEDDSEDSKRADPDDEEQADVDVARNLERRAKGERGHGKHRRGDGDERRGPEDEEVGALGDDVFLDEKFQGVGDRLEKPVRADAHGAEAHLKIGHDLALDEHDEIGRAHV